VTAAVRIFVLSSGSSGNAILVESASGARVLLDAGLGPKVLAGRMRDLGRDLFPRGCDAVVLTHQHNDHFAHVESLARVFKCPLYMHRGISAARVRRRWPTREYDAGRPFSVGDIEVRSFWIPHDAPQMALSVGVDRGPRFGLATDLGHVPRGLASFLGECDAALVESNYCPELLAVGPYPERLRARIRGGYGHLANEQTAELAAELTRTRLARLYLGHISRSNNTPERALAAVVPRATGLAVEAIPHGCSRAFDVAVSARAVRTREQLAFAF
jgi:phosphoribosyl 1,2-cyclic phosphodiesterase